MMTVEFSREYVENQPSIERIVGFVKTAKRVLEHINMDALPKRRMRRSAVSIPVENALAHATIRLRKLRLKPSSRY